MPTTVPPARPENAGQPFSHRSIRKLRGYLADNKVRKVVIGKERLRQILDRHEVTFQKTKPWKQSNDPLKEAKLDRIEEIFDRFADRVFAFDEFGPLAVRPKKGIDKSLAAIKSSRAARPDGEMIYPCIGATTTRMTPPSENAYVVSGPGCAQNVSAAGDGRLNRRWPQPPDHNLTIQLAWQREALQRAETRASERWMTESSPAERP